MRINDTAQEIKTWREGKGFFTPSHIATETRRDLMLGKLMLVVTEVAEMAEAVRHNDPDNFKEEIADTFIRLMDIGATMGIDLEEEIAKKMAINDGRPYKHGKQSSL